MEIFNKLKLIVKILKEAGKIEQYKQILEIQQELLEMQKKIWNLEKKNEELEGKFKNKRKSYL